MRPHKIAVLGATATAFTLIGSLAVQAQNRSVNYKAQLAPLNAKTVGSEVSGEAVFAVSGDKLTIRITAKGVPPKMQHLQHFHGFAQENKSAKCPTVSNDTNADGVIDLIETEPVAGTTMVPFNGDPVSLKIVSNTYPSAGSEGSYIYDKTVSLKALQDAFAAKVNGQKLELDRRVIFIHGVPNTTKLPKSVASLDDIPAQITLPIACGEIKKVAP
jgi:hypothetical protein